jgi:hypothetical protein
MLISYLTVMAVSITKASIGYAVREIIVVLGIVGECDLGQLLKMQLSGPARRKSLLSTQFWYLDLFIAILSFFDWAASTERSFIGRCWDCI